MVVESGVILPKKLVGQKLRRGFAGQQSVIGGHIVPQMVAIRLQQVGIGKDGFFGLAFGRVVFKPRPHSVAVMVGGGRLFCFATQKQGDGVGAGFAKCAASKLSKGDDVEIFEQNLACGGGGGVGIGEDGGAGLYFEEAP